MGEPALPRRPLGRTGLEVSVLSFGGGPLGGIYQDITDDSAAESVREAFRQGVNFFDSSPYYGDTRSETVLGRGLAGLPREQVVVATKCGRYGADHFDFSAARVTASVRESLGRLQTDYIDLIQTHDIEFVNLDQIVNETLPALQRLKKEGLVRHIGITGLPLKIFRTVLDRVEPGTVDTVLSYCHNSLNDRSLLGLLPYLLDKGVGVINASALSMGLLTQRGPPAWHPAPAAVKEAAAAAARAAAERGCDISSIALKAALREGGVDSTLVGMASAEEVRQNVKLAKQALGLVPDDNAEQEAAAAAEVQRILAPIQDVTWPSGLPENN